MIEASQISEFGKIFLYLIMGTFFVMLTFFVGRLVALKRPNPVKLSSYECGEEPVGSSWIQFNSKFYVVALVFLLFDVEMVFIFPWTTVFGQAELIAADGRWGWLTLAEMFIFIGILLIGLMYVWKKGDLNWIKPEIVKPTAPGNIPSSVYDRINAEEYRVRPFGMGAAEADPAAIINEVKPAGFKPAFKPQFRKPSP